MRSVCGYFFSVFNLSHRLVAHFVVLSWVWFYEPHSSPLLNVFSYCPTLLFLLHLWIKETRQHMETMTWAYLRNIHWTISLLYYNESPLCFASTFRHPNSTHNCLSYFQVQHQSPHAQLGFCLPWQDFWLPPSIAGFLISIICLPHL